MATAPVRRRGAWPRRGGPRGRSAAEAQHLTAELVGKLRHDRPPLSAIALHADTSSLTAIGNDYEYDQVFSRQVRAHGRRGDVLVLLSTSGGRANVLSAAVTGRALGMTTWAVTGPRPNPLADACDDALAAHAADPQTVQEMHLVAVHVLCEHVDAALLAGGASDGRPGLRPRWPTSAGGTERPSGLWVVSARCCSSLARSSCSPMTWPQEAGC